MDIEITKEVKLIIDGNDENNGIKIVAYEGVVKTIAVFKGTGDPSRGDDYFYLRHADNLESLVNLRDLISAAIEEAQNQGIE